MCYTYDIKVKYLTNPLSSKCGGIVPGECNNISGQKVKAIVATLNIV